MNNPPTSDSQRGSCLRWTFGIPVPGLLAWLVYKIFLRPWHLSWGATEAEARQSLPGDDLVSNATYQTTRAITILATPETVVPPVSDIPGLVAEDHPAPANAAAERTPAMDWTWAFVLIKIGPNATRLLVRTRAAFHIPRWQAGVTPLLIELPHHVMERKMLLGIRQRAEAK